MTTHAWITSTLGHGEVMCKYCGMTNREAVVLGQLDICEAVPETPPPKVGGVVTDRMVEDAATAYERENPKYKIELHGQALLSALEAAFRAAKEGK